MKKLLLNWRIYVIGILAFIAIFCLFSEPVSNSKYWTEFLRSNRLYCGQID